MKKWILFLVLISVVQVGYRIIPVLAESKEDTSAIKKVIESYYKGRANSDSNLMMKQISTKYSGFDREGETVDYTRFKSDTERRIKDAVNVSISDLKITNLNVQGNKATLEVTYNFKGFRAGAAEEVNVSRKQGVSLVKEGGSWKVVEFKRVSREGPRGPRPQPVKPSP